MVKTDIKRLDSTTANDTAATKTINDNFKALQESIDDTLSRTGKVPNYMETELDLNHNRIINLAEPTEDSDAVSLKYVKDAIGDAAKYEEITRAEAYRAESASKKSQVYSEHSRIWATGDDNEIETVAPGQDEHSSRGYADLSMAIANTPEDVPVDTSTLLAVDVIRGPKGDDGTLGDGDITLQGTLTANSDANHPIVIEGMAGTSASGYQIVDSYGAGESDFEHFATGDRYGTRITNRSTATGKEVCVDLYQTNAGKSVLDTTDVDTVLVKDLQVNGKDVALDETVVHKAGNEDILNIKTFKDRAVFNASSNEKLRLQSTIIDLDVNPNSSINNQLWFADKNGNAYATLQANQQTNGSINFSLTMKSRTGNSYAGMGVEQNADGTARAYAPNTPENAISNSIVTVSYFDSKALQTSEISKAQNGYVKLSNGLIVQWGVTTDATDGTNNRKITFPTPFSNTNYSVTLNGIYTNSSDKGWGYVKPNTKTTTSVDVVSAGYSTNWIAIGY